MIGSYYAKENDLTEVQGGQQESQESYSKGGGEEGDRGVSGGAFDDN